MADDPAIPLLVTAAPHKVAATTSQQPRLHQTRRRRALLSPLAPSSL
jgi:hypothetical protein